MFASYATVDGKVLGGTPFKKFTELLRDLVESQVTKARARLSFVDQNGIKIGDEWESVLAEGISTSEVLVCLVSPRYLSSIWCGRELEVFLRRIEKWKAQGAVAGHPGRFVFLVWWEKPKDRKTLPKSLGAFNPADPDFPPSYYEKGLRQLASLNAGHDDLVEIANTLARRIVETLDFPDKLPSSDAIVDFNSIKSAFEEAPELRPYQIAVLATTPGGIAWSPPGSPENLLQILNRVTSRLTSIARPLDVLKGVGPALAEAHQNRQLVLLLVEASDGPANPVLLEANQCAMPNLAVLVINSGAGSTSTLTPELWAAQFPDGSISQGVRGGRVGLVGLRDLEFAIEALITRVRQPLIQADEPARAEDDAITTEAAELGVPIEQKPNLNLPTSTNRQ
jgi:hypothetical protein